MTCGIYGIKNKINNKIYIGQSINIEKRITRHKTHLKHNKHANQHLQNSYNFYLKEAFEFVILEEVDESLLNQKEQTWIDSLPKEQIYNNQLFIEDKTAHRNSFYGKKHTDATKLKMSEWKKTNYLGENNPNYGKKYDTQVKLKMTLNNSTTKLGVKEVLEIVDLLKEGCLSDKEIACKYSISRTIITRIANGTRWANITGGRILANDRRSKNRK